MAATLQQPAVDADEVFVSEDARRQIELARTGRARELQALNLQRENILSQRTSSPVRRAALESALVHIEKQIELLS